MPKQDSKIQQQQVPTCLLRVNIHCEGCKHKVKKTLKKVEGVYKVNIDAEQGKVSVSGNVDPGTLINKLEKSGKHAEMWGPPHKGPISFNHLNNNNNFHIGKNDKGFKEQKNKGGGGVHQLPQHLNNKNGSKDVKIVGKNQNSVRFNLPEEEYDDDEDDYSDDFDDDEEDGDFDDGSDDGGGYAHHPPGGKGAHLAAHHNPKSNKPTPPKVKKGKNGDKDKNGGDGKKSGGGINMFLKGMLGKASGKNGKVGDGHHKEGNENGSGKKKDKKDGFVHDHGKNNGGKSKESWSKKAGEKFDNGGHKNKESNNKKQAFNEMNMNHRGGGGGGGGGMGDFQGLPKTMNGGHLQGGGGGGGQGNPYNQQQMAMMMMMMNQQNANRPEAYHPLGYAAARPHPPAGMSYGQPPPHAMGYYGQQQPQPAMNYGQPPPMANDQYSHIFSDENTDSCSIM